MIVSMIAAVARNGVIGLDNDLPWRLRDDMRFFMNQTRGHVMITGRKNFDAMGLLRDRTHVVVTRNRDYAAPGAHVVYSVPEALRVAQRLGEQEVFVIGGAQIYEQAYPYAHRFYRTRVLADVPGDVHFPDCDFEGWHSELIAEHAADEHNEHAFCIERLVRPEAPLGIGE